MTCTLNIHSASLKNKNENGAQFDWFYFSPAFPGIGKPGYDSAYAQYWKLIKEGKSDLTPIMLENPSDLQRKSHVFERGNWLVKGDEVQPDVPKSLNAFPASAPRNRLGLAQWLTDTKNPLTARTMVNRLMGAVIRPGACGNTGGPWHAGHRTNTSGTIGLPVVPVHA